MVGNIFEGTEIADERDKQGRVKIRRREVKARKPPERNVHMTAMSSQGKAAAETQKKNNNTRSG